MQVGAKKINLFIFFKSFFFEKISTLYQTTKSWELSKLKAFADDRINVPQKLKFVL